MGYALMTLTGRIAEYTLRRAMNMKNRERAARSSLQQKPTKMSEPEPLLSATAESILDTLRKADHVERHNREGTDAAEYIDGDPEFDGEPVLIFSDNTVITGVDLEKAEIQADGKSFKLNDAKFTIFSIKELIIETAAVVRIEASQKSAEEKTELETAFLARTGTPARIELTSDGKMIFGFTVKAAPTNNAETLAILREMVAMLESPALEDKDLS